MYPEIIPKIPWTHSVTMKTYRGFLNKTDILGKIRQTQHFWSFRTFQSSNIHNTFNWWVFKNIFYTGLSLNGVNILCRNWIMATKSRKKVVNFWNFAYAFTNHNGTPLIKLYIPNAWLTTFKSTPNPKLSNFAPKTSY